jgi:hypothetical protein
MDVKDHVANQIRLAVSPPWKRQMDRTNTDLASRPRKPAYLPNADEEYDFDESLHLLDNTKGYRQIVATWAGDEDTHLTGLLSPPHVQCRAWFVETISPYTFYREMDEISPGCGRLARAIFNNHGNMKSRLEEEGTAVWHWGFGSARILMIDQWTALPDAARQLQVDLILLNTLLTHVSAHYEHFFAVASPTSLLEDGELAWAPRMAEGAPNRELSYRIGILREAGFRRIGTGPCFGWSPDPDHPARQLPAVEDY